ncbi:RHS repeat domain-containing protein [Sphingobacterium humi]|nr:RHS repeat protein [Sphingobacterium humi]
MAKYREIRGQVYKIFDGAGVSETPDYDFKGNVLIQKRTYTEDATQHPDWTSIGSVNLETATYETATVYDALNRPVKLTTPDNGETTYTYDKGGLLKTVEVENVHSLDTEIVNNIEYDAKGQRTKVQYGNGTTTTYEYDEYTFRVKRIRTTRHSDSKELQDLRYWYDPIGNVTLQKDLAQQTVYFDGSVADAKNDYTYDALYRLIQAEGREHAGNNTAPNYNDNGRIGITPVPIASADTAKMRRYTQHYEYDEVGNFITMQHTVIGGTGNWTRYYTTANNSNRLMSTVVGSGTPESYAYDNRGNITGGFIHLQSLTFNAENRLEKVIIDSNRTAYYQYDNAGQRVRKTIVDTNSNITEVRKYIGEWEVYSKSVSSTLTIERETLHISDDTGRIALIDTRTTGTGAEPAQLLRYQYSNHLGTATLELDDAGAIISYEEYFSYGSTSFQSGRSLAEVSLKRFKYCSCERDEESGLYSMGRRYYIPWLASWTAVDMLQSEMPMWSPYNYGFCNPVKWTDTTGMQPEDDKKPRESPQQLQENKIDYKGEDSLKFFENGTEGFMFLSQGTNAKGESRDYWIGAVPLDSMEGFEYYYYDYDLVKSTGNKDSGWVSFWNDKEIQAIRMKATEQFIRVTQVGFTTSLTLPFGGIGTGFNFTMRGLSSLTDAGGQYLTNGFDIGKINITSGLASGILMNPVASESIGQGFAYTYNDGFKQSYILGDMSDVEFSANIGIALGVGLTFKGLNIAISTSGGTQNSIGIKRDLLILGRQGALNSLRFGNTIMGTWQSATSNTIQKMIIDQRK